MSLYDASTNEVATSQGLDESSHTVRDVQGIDTIDPDDQLLHSENTLSTPKHTGNNASMSAVYRWYDVEATFSLKRREESSIAHCKLCREEGKLERKSFVRFSKSVTSNLWRHLKDSHPQVYAKHAGEKKTIQMHTLVHAKKRGRMKKKMNEQGTESEEVNQQNLDEEEEGNNDLSRKQHVKKSKRTGASTRIIDDEKFYSESVRKAAVALCIENLLPFSFCLSRAFNTLLKACEATSTLGTEHSVLGSEVWIEHSTKIVGETMDCVSNALRKLDGVHIMVVAFSVGNIAFMAYVAVGLDKEFIFVYRCVRVVPMGMPLEVHVLEGISLHAFAPSVMVVERPIRCRKGMSTTPQLVVMTESITNVLEAIALSTVMESTWLPDAYVIGIAQEHADEYDSFTVGVDSIRFSRPPDVSDMHDEMEPIHEVASKILNDLPTVLSGCAIRDVIFKVLYFAAHVKDSIKTRGVLRRLSLQHEWVRTEINGLTLDSFAHVFRRERAKYTSNLTCGTIHDVLVLMIKMKPLIQVYFDVHKTNGSHFSKLIQLVTLSSDEWDRVACAIVLLRPFSEAITKFETEAFVTSSLIIPSMSTLLEKLQEMTATADASSVVLSNLAYTKLSSAFEYLLVTPMEEWSLSRYTTFKWLWAATLLDPRTKPFLVKGPLAPEQFWDIVKAETATICGTHILKDDEAETTNLGSESVKRSIEAITIGNNTNDVWAELQANLTSCAQTEVLGTNSATTLERTKSINLIDVEVSFFQEETPLLLEANPLEWWQQMRIKYPFIARLARYVLSIPTAAHVTVLDELRDGGLLHQVQTSKDMCDLVCTSLNLRLLETPPTSVKSSWTVV